MNFDSIYSVGSSFSCAGGLGGPEVKKLYKKLHSVKINNNINESYPNIISKLNELQIINESVPGGSANRMIRKVYNYIHNNQNNSKSTLFLLEIPPMWRDEFYSNEFDRMINITWGVLKNSNDNTGVANNLDTIDYPIFVNEIDEYFKKFINIDIEIKKTMNNILGLLSYFKINNIQYIIINGFEFYTFLLKNNLKTDYNFYWVDGYIESINISFIRQNLTITHELNNLYEDNHLGYFGNYYVANDLNQFIKTKIL